jgi:hypothetical protein
VVALLKRTVGKKTLSLSESRKTKGSLSFSLSRRLLSNPFSTCPHVPRLLLCVRSPKTRVLLLSRSITPQKNIFYMNATNKQALSIHLPFRRERFILSQDMAKRKFYMT